MSVPKVYDDAAVNQLFDRDLFDQITAIGGCTTLLAFLGCSIEVCYEVVLGGINVKAVFKTPIGDLELGSGNLTPDKTEIKLGVGKGYYKAEISISFDFNTKVLKSCGKISVKIPFNGTKSKEGCTEAHL
jgi:hypothetical protein